jgi:hypothetical protein
VKVQQLRITPGSKTDGYVIHISLVRSVRPDNVAIGSVALSIDGAGADGKPTTLDQPALTLGKQHELPFNFRYFENVDQDVALPKGFKAEHVSIEVRSSKKDVAPASQSFPWVIEAS